MPLEGTPPSPSLSGPTPISPALDNAVQSSETCTHILTQFLWYVASGSTFSSSPAPGEEKVFLFAHFPNPVPHLPQGDSWRYEGLLSKPLSLRLLLGRVRRPCFSSDCPKEEKRTQSWKRKGNFGLVRPNPMERLRNLKLYGLKLGVDSSDYE